MRRSPLLLVGLGTVIFLAGCGSSTTVTETATAPPATATITTTTSTPTTTPTAAPATVTSTTTTTPASTPAARTVPGDLDNHPLNADESELDSDGIGYQTVGGGTFGIIVKSDWGVCDTKPGTGQPVHGPVQLIVGHFTCGVQ